LSVLHKGIPMEHDNVERAKETLIEAREWYKPLAVKLGERQTCCGETFWYCTRWRFCNWIGGKLRDLADWIDG